MTGDLTRILETRTFSSVSEFKLTVAVTTGSPLANIRRFPPFLTVEILNSIIYRPWFKKDRQLDNLTANFILFIEEKYISLNTLDISDFMIWLGNSSFRYQNLGARLFDCLKKSFDAARKTK